jgi:hypothetical protein
MQDECFGAKHFTLAPSIVKMPQAILGQGLRPAAARSDRLQSKRTPDISPVSGRHTKRPQRRPAASSINRKAGRKLNPDRDRPDISPG